MFRGTIASRYIHQVDGGVRISAVMARAFGRRIGAMLMLGMEIAPASETAAQYASPEQRRLRHGAERRGGRIGGVCGGHVSGLGGGRRP